MPAKGVDPQVLTGEDLLARFTALDTFLTAHQALWKPRPFTHLQLPWETSYPELATWLRGRSLEEAESAHNHPALVDAPQPFASLAAMSLALSAVDELPAHALEAPAHRLNVDVPGRKWQQIEAFASRLQFADTAEALAGLVLGQGTPGSTPAANRAATDLPGIRSGAGCQRPGTQPAPSTARAACRTGCTGCRCGFAIESSAHTRRSACLRRFACATDPARQRSRLQTTRHRTLLLQPDQHRPGTQPMSSAAQRSDLQLSLDDLGLPMSETVTAGARVRRQRDTSMARRLGFDLLQRQLRGVDEYLPTPSLPSAWLDKPFAEYCQHLADLKELSTIGAQNWSALEAAGWQRLAQVRNLELLRGLFRRPLELMAGARSGTFPTRTGLHGSPRHLLRNLAHTAQHPAAGGTSLSASQPVDNSVDEIFMDPIFTAVSALIRH